MPRDDGSARFETQRELRAEAPTLIEGFPGLGMVASIAVDQITTQLGLEQYGAIASDDLPPVAAFHEGRVRDAVRVYAGDDPPVMTLLSDVAVPPSAVPSLSRCVLTEIAPTFDRAVYLAGAPARSEEQVGDVVAVASTDALEAELAEVGVELADWSGVIGGITGALLDGCYHADVPAAALVVRTDPYIPDPRAARAVIETALEPLVDFDIDTENLLEQAEEIQRQKQQIAEQLKRYQEAMEAPPQPGSLGMYQ